MINPIDKGIAQDYRNTMFTSGAPQNIDTDIAVIPVAVINQGLPKPTSKQLMYKYNFVNTTADAQVITRGSNQRVYYLGCQINMGAGCTTVIFDGTSGTGAQTNGDTVTLIRMDGAVQMGYFPPLPIECVNGIRISVTAAANARITVFYVVESTVV